MEGFVEDILRFAAERFSDGLSIKVAKVGHFNRYWAAGRLKKRFLPAERHSGVSETVFQTALECVFQQYCRAAKRPGHRETGRPRFTVRLHAAAPGRGRCGGWDAVPRAGGGRAGRAGRGCGRQCFSAHHGAVASPR
ncbi:hypothetical protein NEIELOOT_01331, partial [Neisseria elongata subsp. glycolytica ATCC 29315]